MIESIWRDHSWKFKLFLHSGKSVSDWLIPFFPIKGLFCWEKSEFSSLTPIFPELPSIRTDEVLIDRMHVLIGGCDRLDGELVFKHDPVQEQVKLIGVTSADQQALAVLVDLDFHDVVLLEDV